jgi:hypothetical protein
MADKKACDEIQNAWDTVSAKWSAEVKSRYFSQIYLPLQDEAEGIYQRNDDLEAYAEECVRSLRA